MVAKIIAVLLIITNVFAVDLVNSSFVDFVRFVSNSTNKNFIIDEDINKNISIIIPHSFKNKDSYKVLVSVLRKNNMYLERFGSVYYIKKAKKIKKFHSYKLVFLLPDKIIPILKKYYPDIRVSKSKKTIIFHCFDEDYKQIVKLISLLDKPTKSKKIKISLISYKDNDLTEFGLNLDIGNSNSEFTARYKTFLDNLVSRSSLAVSYKTFDITAFFSDLQTHELIDFKFSPTLSLYDGKTTTFSITQNIPYLEGTRQINGDNDIENNVYKYNDVGSLINIDKVSITDNSIYFHISMKYEVVLERSVTPTTSKRLIDNYLKINDGESVLIAGLKSDELSKVHREIPLLSSLPVLGDLFKWDSDKHNEETFAIVISSVAATSQPPAGLPLKRDAGGTK